MKKSVFLTIVSLSLIFSCLLCGCAGKNTETVNTEENTVPADTTEAAVLTTAEETTAPAPEPVKVLTLSNFSDWVKFNGRTYVDSKDNSVHFDWSLGGFEINFTGTGVKADLVSSLGSKADNNTMVYVYVDGEESAGKTIWLNDKAATYVLAENLEETAHTLKLVKRNCVSKASAGVTKIEVLGSDKAEFTEKPAKKERLIEFIGDSLTAGDGIATPNGRKEYVSVCQDATLAYANLVGKAFNADVSLVCRCGSGLVWNSSGKDEANGGIPIPSVYDYACKYNSDEKWDFANNQPDLIVINLGTNDKKMVFPSGTTADATNKARFTDAYYKFLKHIRELNPDVPILCTIGQMVNSNYDLGIKSVVTRLTSEGYSGLMFLQLQQATATGVGGHPLASAQSIDAKHYFLPVIKKMIPEWNQ